MTHYERFAANHNAAPQLSQFSKFNQLQNTQYLPPQQDQYSNFMQSGGFTQNSSMMKTGQM